ncbi:MAG: hypothetical protein M1388_03295 [Thaumarchaeota archaeon]|nr:hypothetical protein [Nitrososphaerota archaeon]
MNGSFTHRTPAMAQGLASWLIDLLHEKIFSDGGVTNVARTPSRFDDGP